MENIDTKAPEEGKKAQRRNDPRTLGGVVEDLRGLRRLLRRRLSRAILEVQDMIHTTEDGSVVSKKAYEGLARTLREAYVEVLYSLREDIESVIPASKKEGAS